MKIVTYSDKMSFTLTELEYEEAKACWEQKESYECFRLGAMLSPHFMHVRTPRDEMNREIFLYFWGDNDRNMMKLFRTEDERWIEILPGGELMEWEEAPDLESGKLVSQEDYFNKEGGSLGAGGECKKLN